MSIKGRIILKILFLGCIIFLSGCVSPTCNKPYILVGNYCCLDQNDNNVCDGDESAKEEKLKNTILQTKVFAKFNEMNQGKDFNITLAAKESYDIVLKDENITKEFEEICGQKISPKSYYQFVEYPYFLLIDSETLKVECDTVLKTGEDLVESKSKVDQSIIKKMNEDVTVDYLTYKVTKAETFTEMGTSFFNKKTEGKFVKVYVKILNNAKESQNIFSPRFTLEDNQGRRFDEFPSASLYITDSLDFGQQLQPGLSISGAVVFELPKDAQDLKLVITGDWLSETEVIVQLSNIQNIGKDTTKKEEQDKQFDELFEESEEKTQELLNKCSAPFVCSSSCSEYADVGQKDCPSGEVCCLE